MPNTKTNKNNTNKNKQNKTKKKTEENSVKKGKPSVGVTVTRLQYTV